MSPHRPLTGKVVIATHNAGKLREMQELLAPFGVEAVSAGALGLPVPDETGHIFAENAAIKAHAAAKATGLPALSDDSGLCVHALDGAPGLFTADWAGPKRDFYAAMERVKLRVKPEHFQLFYLSAVKGLSTREVARMLQVSAGQVYLIRHRLAKEVKREVEHLKKKPL